MTTATRPSPVPPLTYTGKPRDIDAIDGEWTQAVIHAANTDELVCETNNDRIVDVLLLAVELNTDVTVDYVDAQPPQLAAATLQLDVTGQDGQVQSVGFNDTDGCFRAVIAQKGTPQHGWTTNTQVQVVIEAAARGGIPVEAEVDSDTHKIVRAKINVPVEE